MNRSDLARLSYSALLGALTPANLMRLLWRSRAEPLYRADIAARLGFYADAPSRGWVWLHAVSLGETRAATALIDRLREALPGMRLLLTTSTATGREAGGALLREGDRQTWLPFDTPGAVRRFLAHFQPAIGVLMETEIWPNLLHQAQQARLPMVLANARLSAKSQARGEAFSALMRPAAESVGLVLAQTEDDAIRLRASGARKVIVCGNLKFDVAPDATLLARGRAWRALAERPIVLGASTREGEEPLLLSAWRGQPAPRPRLLIVPRHPQRFNEVGALVEQSGFSLSRRSTWREAPDDAALAADVWLGDSLGEMPLYYGSADVALLGGSFLPLGGQNLIEAAACGCPMVMGPHTFNFAAAAELSLQAGAALREPDMPSGVARAVALAGDAALADYAARALAFAGAHRGAAERMAQHIAVLVANERLAS